jgi:hypothetical protein
VQREIKDTSILTWGKERSKLGPCQGKQDGREVRTLGGVGSAISGDDNDIGELNGETGGDNGVGWDK